MTPTPQSVLNPPQKMFEVEKAYLRQMGRRARRLFPGPLGDWIDEEFNVAADFGIAIGAGSTMMRVAKAIEAPWPWEKRD